MSRQFKLEVVGSSPLPFPPPSIVEVDDVFAQEGVELILESFEHPGGPFAAGVTVDYKVKVLNVAGRFRVSNAGFEDVGKLPILRVAFVVN